MSGVEQPDPEQIAIFARQSPAQKLVILRRLRNEVLDLKEAWPRQQHPDEDDEAIRRRLRAWQLHGLRPST